MGFSVSGSAAIVFAGLFIGFGMFYTATANTVERVDDARTDETSDYVELKNAEVEIGSHYNSTSEVLNVTVNNTGAETLAISDIDILVNGTYVTGYNSVTVSGDRITPTSGTDVLSPGEQVRYNITWTSQANRVKVVAGPGVAGFNQTVTTP